MSEPTDALKMQPKTPADLPEVHPPSAGFIVQLFGIPLAIVAVAVIVWLLFGKLATDQRMPEDYLAEMKSSNFERRWAAARELAGILPRHKHWQGNEAFAEKLAAELEHQLASGTTAPKETRYLQYIAQSLGEFSSQTPIRALRMALNQELDRDVREAAVMGLGHLADRIGGIQDPGAISDLLAMTEDQDESIRLRAIWVLGNTANPAAVEGLSPLVDHPDSEVRFNAATSLARLGSPSGLETLSEMLDLNSVKKGLEDRRLSNSQIQSQMEAVPWSALQSLSILLDRAPGTHLEHLRPAIEKLSKEGSPVVRTRAKELLIKMSEPPNP